MNIRKKVSSKLYLGNKSFPAPLGNPPPPIGNIYIYFPGNSVISKGPEKRWGILQEMSQRLMMQGRAHVRAKQRKRLRYAFCKLLFIYLIIIFFFCNLVIFFFFFTYHYSWTSLLRLLMLCVFVEGLTDEITSKQAKKEEN